jgi:hypothetical protein
MGAAERESHPCPLPDATLDVEASVHAANDPNRDCQAEAGPFPERLRREERLEDAWQDIGGNAGAFVLNGDPNDVVEGVDDDTNRQTVPLAIGGNRVGLCCVNQQISKYLQEEVASPDDFQRLIPVAADDVHRYPRPTKKGFAATHRGDALLQEFTDADMLKALDAADPPSVEELANDPSNAPHHLDRLAKRFWSVGREPPSVYFCE